MKNLLISLFLICNISFAEEYLSQSQMNTNSSLNLQESKEKMLKIYDELYSKLNNEEKLKLKSEQEKWEIYKNKESQKELEELGVGGTMASSLLTSSKKYYTNERIKELTKKLKNLKINE